MCPPGPMPRFRARRLGIIPHKKQFAQGNHALGVSICFDSLQRAAAFLAQAVGQNRLFGNLELVSDSPDGLQIPLVRHTFQFFSQALDVNVDRARISEIVKAPDLVQKLVAGKDPVRG